MIRVKYSYRHLMRLYIGTGVMTPPDAGVMRLDIDTG